MTGFVFPAFKQALLTAALNFPAATVRAALVSAIPSSSDEFLADVTVVATCPALSGGALVSGSYTSDPAIFSVVTGAPIVGFVLYLDSGSPAISALVAYQDAVTGAALPYTPSGGGVSITPASPGWFTL